MFSDKIGYFIFIDNNLIAYYYYYDLYFASIDLLITLHIYQAENRAEYSERQVIKLQKDVERLEGTLAFKCLF
jgi:hypothetical protein